MIEAAGADLKPPADARVIDLAGKTVYAGLIDAFGEITTKQAAAIAFGSSALVAIPAGGATRTR